jgi:hypothetical protein
MGVACKGFLSLGLPMMVSGKLKERKFRLWDDRRVKSDFRGPLSGMGQQKRTAGTDTVGMQKCSIFYLRLYKLQ